MYNWDAPEKKISYNSREKRAIKKKYLKNKYPRIFQK